jgi:hypothetical protein
MVIVYEVIMSKIQEYRVALKKLPSWETYLKKNSALPGPRANLELMQAAADEGSKELFLQYIAYSPQEAPENTPRLFLVVCGIVGLGRLLAEGDGSMLKVLRPFASDPRWRVREAVCMALQRWGHVDIPALLQEMQNWGKGSFYEQRASVATLCEPALLENKEIARSVLALLDEITASIPGVQDRKQDSFRVLRKALAYGWSVAVVALPAEGKRMMEKWLGNSNHDIRWIMRQNLKKNRLIKMDPGWVESYLGQIE